MDNFSFNITQHFKIYSLVGIRSTLILEADDIANFYHSNLKDCKLFAYCAFFNGKPYMDQQNGSQQCRLDNDNIISCLNADWSVITDARSNITLETMNANLALIFKLSFNNI